MLYHPDFKHHYIDHWLGFYLSKNEEYEPHKWRCPTIKYKVAHNSSISNTKDDMYDMSILRNLTDLFVKDKTPYIENINE